MVRTSLIQPKGISYRSTVVREHLHHAESSHKRRSIKWLRHGAKISFQAVQEGPGGLQSTSRRTIFGVERTVS